MIIVKPFEFWSVRFLWSIAVLELFLIQNSHFTRGAVSYEVRDCTRIPGRVARVAWRLVLNPLTPVWQPPPSWKVLLQRWLLPAWGSESSGETRLNMASYTELQSSAGWPGTSWPRRLHFWPCTDRLPGPFPWCPGSSECRPPAGSGDCRHACSEHCCQGEREREEKKNQTFIFILKKTVMETQLLISHKKTCRADSQLVKRIWIHASLTGRLTYSWARWSAVWGFPQPCRWSRQCFLKSHPHPEAPRWSWAPLR